MCIIMIVAWDMVCMRVLYIFVVFALLYCDGVACVHTFEKGVLHSGSASVSHTEGRGSIPFTSIIARKFW